MLNKITTAVQARSREILECFGVELIHPAEAAKLSLPPVKIPVVIFVGGDQFRFADVVDHLHFVDDLHRERQLGDPGGAVGLILKEVFGRGRIAHPRRRAHVVAHFGEDVGFDAAAKIEGFVIAFGLSRIIVAPQEGRGAGSEYVGKLNGVHVADESASPEWSPYHSIGCRTG